MREARINEHENPRSRRLHLAAAADGEYSARDRRAFFHPTPVFVRWLKTHHGDQHIYDIGSGMGHVAKALAKAGLRVTAIDLEPRTESEFPVIKADSTQYPFDRDSVVMFCRPSHSGFVEKTIAKAIQCRVAAIVYVGLRRNQKDDLKSHSELFKMRRIGMVGHSGECVWELNVKRLRAEASQRRSIPRLSSNLL